MIDKTIRQLHQNRYADLISQGMEHNEAFNLKEKEMAEALTAIYEIGLEVIGENPPESEWWRYSGEPLGQIQLVAFQRKAWAKACGVSGGYIPGAGWVTVGEGKGEE